MKAVDTIKDNAASKIGKFTYFNSLWRKQQ